MLTRELRQIEPRDMTVVHKHYDDRAERIRELLATDGLRGAFERVMTMGNALVVQMASEEVDSMRLDVFVDRGWGGLNDVMSGVLRVLSDGVGSGLTDEERARRERLVEAQRRLMGADMRFLLLPHADQWSECLVRLQRLDLPLRTGGTVREALETEGLGWAIARLERLHERYGQALGLAQSQSDLERSIEAWRQAVGRLLAGVVFHHSDDDGVMDSEIKALLLEPIEQVLVTARERRRKRAERAARRDAEIAVEAFEPDAAQPPPGGVLP